MFRVKILKSNDRRLYSGFTIIANGSVEIDAKTKLILASNCAPKNADDVINEVEIKLPFIAKCGRDVYENDIIEILDSEFNSLEVGKQYRIVKQQNIGFVLVDHKSDRNTPVVIRDDGHFKYFDISAIDPKDFRVCSFY